MRRWALAKIITARIGANSIIRRVARGRRREGDVI